jgi:TRAP-type uncharacterized transport system substrate-binding protein
MAIRTLSLAFEIFADWQFMASFKENVKETFLGLSESIREHWTDFTQFLQETWPILLVLLMLIVGIGIYADPPPPRHVMMATGTTGGSSEMLGKQYAEFFAKKGITLELIPTNGAQENINRLSDRNDPLQAAFVQAGVVHTKDITGIHSLGVIAYDPIWFFYRGPEMNSKDFQGVDGRFKYFLNKKISIGNVGSGTHAQAMKILSISGYEPGSSFVNLPNDQAVKALQKGEIDGVFIVDTYYSANVQALLKDPQLHIGTFGRAEAYTKLVPYLSILEVPEGAFDLKRNFPSSDIKLLATTTNLLIDDRMHPAIQFLFLQAAKEINGKATFFAHRGEFPSFKNTMLPESPVAVHYEKNNSPFVVSLLAYLPFWLAELVNHIVFIVLPFLIISYPILQALPGFRTRRMQNKINRLYSDLKSFEQELLIDFDLGQRDEYLKRLDILEYRALNIKVSKRLAGEYYSLRTSIDYVRNCLNRGVQPYQINESAATLAIQVLDKVEPVQTTPGNEKPPKSELLL